MADVETIWDGKFIQHMPHDEAIVAQSAGLVQIFEGPDGYQPGFFMKDPSEFPFSYTFNPLSLFKPGDIGGLVQTSDIASLFQTRTGPTVPVTGDGDPVEFATTQNPGGLSFSRPLTGAGFDYLAGLIAAREAGASSSTLNTATLGAGFEQMTLVGSALLAEVDTPSAIQITAFQYSAQNTAAFGGAGLALQRRSDRSARLTLTTRVPPSGQPSAIINAPNIEHDTKIHVFGAVLDSESSTQKVFFNDIEDNPTLAYSPITSAASVAQLIGFSNLISGGIMSLTAGWFYINRKLSNNELQNLKTWFASQQLPS